MTHHAIDRAMERYGLTLTQSDLDAILAELPKAGLLQIVYDDGSRVWITRYRDNILRPVTNRDADAILTFLPLSGKLSKKRLSRDDDYRPPKERYRRGQRLYK